MGLFSSALVSLHTATLGCITTLNALYHSSLLTFYEPHSLNPLTAAVPCFWGWPTRLIDATGLTCD